VTGVATSVGQAAASSQREADDETAAVVTFWQGLGLPGLVDVHTHFMPPNVLSKVWAFFEQGHARTELDALARLDLGPAWLRAVCHDNAARLLGV
jgi:imidazolonepropionase-like amidohydrolase